MEKEAAKAKDAAKAEEAVDQEATKIMAHGQHGHEKKVLYRERMGSHKEASDVEAGDQGFDEENAETPGIEEETVLGEPKFMEVKKQFIKLLDAFNEGELGKITFI